MGSRGAKLLGIDRVRLYGWRVCPDQIRAYVIADNRLAKKSRLGQRDSAIDLQHLIALDNDLDSQR